MDRFRPLFCTLLGVSTCCLLISTTALTYGQEERNELAQRRRGLFRRFNAASPLHNARDDGYELSELRPEVPELGVNLLEASIDDVREDADIELNDELLQLRAKVQDCLSYYYARPAYAGNYSPWGIMHSLIAFGVDTQLLVDDRRVNAIGWLCWNGPCRGMQLLDAADGQVWAHQGPGYEGHPGQFLSMLAQSRVRKDYELRVHGQTFTVADLIEHEMRSCRAGTELTFKLIALSHYLKSDATWQNDLGEQWSIPRLIQEELAQTVTGAACGGTHRMTGFSYAVNTRSRRGETFSGQWLRAKKFVEDYHDYTFKLQNADGSFSTNWFHGRGDYGGPERRMETSGHILEWLAYSLPREQLTDPRMVRAVDYLASLLLEHRDYDWEIGPKGHALHALVIYEQRVFGAQPGQRRAELAGETAAVPAD